VHGQGVAVRQVPQEIPTECNQIQVAKMLEEGRLEVLALCHDTALAIYDFAGVSFVLPMVGPDLDMLRGFPTGEIV
jgi:hypothetical protein